MKRLLGHGLFGLVMFVMAAAATAAQITVTAAPGVGRPYGGAQNGAAGFYTLNIDGQTVFGFCDDVTTEIAVNDTWQANIYSEAGVNGGGGKFSPKTKYNQAGYLFSLALMPGVTTTQAADLDQAIWAIMDPSVFSYLAGDALTAYNAATSGLYDNFDYSGIMMVVTPVVFSQGQEYLIPTGKVPPSEVPLPGAFWLLASGVTMIFGASRRRRGR